MEDRTSTCPACSVELTGHGTRVRCPRCRSLWVREGVLRGFVGEVLAANNLGDVGVVLQELPGGQTAVGCPSCGIALSPVKLRGVAVARCTACHRVLLPQGAVGMIARRSLLAARALRRTRRAEGEPPRVRLSRRPTHLEE